MERTGQICKLVLLIALFPAMLFGASGDTVIDGMPVETLSADRIVQTDPRKRLVSAGCTSQELDNLTNGTNADALHVHAASAITNPEALTKTDDTNVTLTLGGTPNEALLRAVSLGLGWTGTLASSRLNSNVVQSITNDTNVTGSIAAQNLTLGWAGQLAVGRGGTGASTLNDLITLGTHTTGNYVATGAVAGTGMSGSASSEGAMFTVTLTTDKDIVASSPLTGGANDVLPGADSDVTIGITVEKDITVSGTGMSGGADNVLPGADSDVTITLTTAKDLVVSGTGMSGGENDVFPGADSDVNVTLTVAKDLVAGNGLTGGENDVFPGADADVTIALDTPGTLTSATTNSSSGNHTHAITTYDLSGTASQVTVTGAGKVLGAATTLSLPNPINVSTSANAATVTVQADNTTDATNYLLFSDAVSGAESPRTDTGLTYNPNSNTLTTTTFSGALSGNAATATKAVTYENDATLVDGTVAGQVTIVVATGALPFAETANIKLSSVSSTFNMLDGDTITLVWTGSLWLETGRSFAF